MPSPVRHDGEFSEGSTAVDLFFPRPVPPRQPDGPYILAPLPRPHIVAISLHERGGFPCATRILVFPSALFVRRPLP